MKELVIDRSKWLRGEEPCLSSLHRPKDGKMCCLGIYLESCGVPVDVLSDRKYPSGVRSELPAEAQWLVAPGYESVDAIPTKLAVTNDTRKLTEREREHQIQELFAAADIAVTFVDGSSLSSSQEKP